MVQNKNSNIAELYESRIIDTLRKCEKEGKGKLEELCTIHIGDRSLPNCYI